MQRVQRLISKQRESVILDLIRHEVNFNVTAVLLSYGLALIQNTLISGVSHGLKHTGTDCLNINTLWGKHLNLHGHEPLIVPRRLRNIKIGHQHTLLQIIHYSSDSSFNITTTSYNTGHIGGTVFNSIDCNPLENLLQERTHNLISVRRPIVNTRGSAMLTRVIPIGHSRHQCGHVGVSWSLSHILIITHRRSM